MYRTPALLIRQLPHHAVTGLVLLLLLSVSIAGSLSPEQLRQRLRGTWSGAGVTIVILDHQAAIFGGRKCRYIIREDIIQFQPEDDAANFANYRLQWPDADTLVLHHPSGTSYSLRRVNGGGSATGAAVPSPAIPAPPAADTSVAVSDDGTCRLPLPAGYAIRNRQTPSGLQTTASGLQYLAGRETREVRFGGQKIARLTAFHGGLRFPGDRPFPELAEELFREFMRTDILEDGTYHLARPALSRREGDGVRITVELATDYGLRKRVSYLDASRWAEGRPVRTITLTECEFFDDGPLFRIMGFQIAGFGELLVAGRVIFALDQAEHERHGASLLAAAAGIHLRKPGRNQALEQALVGLWTRSSAYGSGPAGSPAGHVVSHLTFFNNNTFLRRTHVTGDGSTTVTGRQLERFFVFGHLIVYETADGQTESYPVRLDGRVLTIGPSSYVRE